MNRRRQSFLLLFATLQVLYSDSVFAQAEEPEQPTKHPSRPVVRWESDERSEPWLGEDKVEHFFVSSMMTGFGFFVLREPLTMSQHVSLVGGAGFALTAGIIKEYRDSRRNRGVASLKDLIADILGVGLTIFLIKLN